MPSPSPSPSQLHNELSITFKKKNDLTFRLNLKCMPSSLLFFFVIIILLGKLVELMGMNRMTLALCFSHILLEKL